MLKNIFMKFLFIILVNIYVLSAHAIEWSNAPLACLPSRAEKWTDSSNVPLCHCPPQSYCSDAKINLTPKNISFYIEWGGANGFDHSGEILGNEIEGIKNGSVPLKDVFEYDPLQMREFLYQPIFDKFGVNTKKTIKGAMPIKDIRVNILLKNNDDVLKKWDNNTLKLPLALASKCCGDSVNYICPDGTTPKYGDITVVDPVSSEGEYLFSTEIFAGYIKDLKDYHAAMGTLPDDDILVFYKYYAAQDLNSKLLPAIARTDSLVAEMTPHLSNPSLKPLMQKLISRFKDLGKTLKAEEQRRTLPKQYMTLKGTTCKEAISYAREGCLHGGTKITMADGTTRTIETLKLGDEVKGNHGAAKIIALSKFTQQEDRMYSINGGKAFFTVEHPVLTPQGWKSVDSTVTSVKSNAKIIGTLKVGDIILMEGGKQLKVTSIKEELLEGGIDAYNLSVTGDGSFIANGFIMKSFKQMQMHY